MGLNKNRNDLNIKRKFLDRRYKIITFKLFHHFLGAKTSVEGKKNHQ